MNLIFDLDGTVIDSKMRLFRLFQELTSDSSLSFEAYWTMKQNKISNETILADRLGYGDAAIGAFVHDWMGAVEAPRLLALDSKIPGVDLALARLGENADLYICTARQDPDSAIGQLELFGLRSVFTDVLVTRQALTKTELIRRRLTQLAHSDWMIGDTGDDVRVGKSLSIKTCSVLTGFRNRQSLAGYEPDLIVDSVADLTPGMLVDV